MIRREAESWGLSLNKTIKRLLEKSLGITSKHRRKSDFSEFYGVWSKKDAEEFERAVQDFEKIDREDWK